jgi:hypothetical protein
MLIYTVELGWPPGTNNLYGTGRRDERRHLSIAGRQWHRDSDNRALVQWPKGGIELPLTGGLALSLLLRPPRKLHYDADGKIKIVQDWLATYLGFDDARIDRVCAEKGPPLAFGAVIVRLETME